MQKQTFAETVPKFDHTSWTFTVLNAIFMWHLNLNVYTHKRHFYVTDLSVFTVTVVRSLNSQTPFLCDSLYHNVYTHKHVILIWMFHKKKRKSVLYAVFDNFKLNVFWIVCFDFILNYYNIIIVIIINSPSLLSMYHHSTRCYIST